MIDRQPSLREERALHVLGIDLGTQGARAMIVDGDGRVNGEAARPLPADQVAPRPDGCYEQDPAHWRRAVLGAVGEVMGRFRAAGGPGIAAVSATSTSGTLCLVDAEGAPVCPAMMYSDLRAAALVPEVRAAAAGVSARLGSEANASYALVRLVWLARHRPELLERARWTLSPTDLVLGWLTGTWGHSDYSNMLKWGYDLLNLCWPGYITAALGLPERLLPTVHAPGSVIGAVSAAAARETGLEAGTPVVAGATDGTASQLASGAAAPGEWNSTLGTTLVLKGVSRGLLRDPQGRVYCHRHPDGWWLPGAASSTGAECLSQRFGAERLPALNAAALERAPTDMIVYPLLRRGERFPFVHEEAAGFILGESDDEAVCYAAHLEGLAYVERLGYEVVADLGAEVGEYVYAAGGAVQSDAGLQIRAAVLGRALRLPQVPQAAMGAAILAGRGCAFDSVGEAAAQMVRLQRTVWPRQELADVYSERYGRFLGACRERGYLP